MLLCATETRQEASTSIYQTCFIILSFTLRYDLSYILCEATLRGEHTHARPYHGALLCVSQRERAERAYLINASRKRRVTNTHTERVYHNAHDDRTHKHHQYTPLPACTFIYLRLCMPNVIRVRHMAGAYARVQIKTVFANVCVAVEHRAI